MEVKERLGSLEHKESKRRLEHHHDSQKQLSNSQNKKKDWGALPKLNTDPMQDEKYVRRLKMANYGNWYLMPSDYQKKVKKISKELQHLK